MYLSNLNIEGYKNFRDSFEIKFSKGLNVLVGENSVGKSAIIDALRLLLLEDEFGRNLVSESDFHSPFDKPNSPVAAFRIFGIFNGLSQEEKVAFLPWTDENGNATLTVQVDNKLTPRGRFKWESWGGASRSSMFERELFETIHCIYLPPLRDAEAKLSEGKGSRLARLLRNLNKRDLKKAQDENKLHSLEEEVKGFNEKLTGQDSIKKANLLIRTRLAEVLGSVFGQDTQIQYSQTNFNRIVENLRLLFYPGLKADTPSEMFRSLDQNSLGYNNLLYLATVLAELTEETAEDPKYLRLLLIEEPEAHLHPQLQIKLLKYLEAQSKKNNVQVIVTTHSPVLASAVSIESLIHLSSSSRNLFQAVSINECKLNPETTDFVSRWLDATKSVLFFAKGLILVEGISEAMLLPELAKRVLAVYNKKPAKGKRLPDSIEEAGVSVINMNGIFFKYFLQPFCDITGKDHKGRIPIRCAGITDQDPSTDSVPTVSRQVKGNNPALSLVKDVNTSPWTRLYAGKLKTFEYDLAMEGENYKTMLTVLIQLWPTNGSVKLELNEWLKKDVKQDENARAKLAALLLERIEDQNIGKGLFAQMLASYLSDQTKSFAIPDYLQKAVIWACGGNPDGS
jgi:predicted ATP-dependent endonuclease of OLD family